MFETISARFRFARGASGGVGNRHIGAASISRITRAVGIVVSESATVRVFENGALVAEIVPARWLLSRRIVQLHGPVHTGHIRDLAVPAPEDTGAS